MFAEYNVYSQLPALIAGQFIMKLHIMLCQFFNLRLHVSRRNTLQTGTNNLITTLIHNVYVLE